MKTISEIRQDFPFIATSKVIYFDNGATTQKPGTVIEGIKAYNESGHANVHRGAYNLSVMATESYEGGRVKVQKLLGAGDKDEIIFTRGTTESINLVADSYGELVVGQGDEIVVTIFEHHSNIVPWQQLAKRKKANLKFIYQDEDSLISLKEVAEKITHKTKIVGITGTSNALGSKLPVGEVIRIAHSKGAKVVVDAAQWIAHEQIDVVALDVDFLAFSGHKLYGPTGVGVLYGKKALLQMMKPYQFGGDMIEYVSEQETTFAQIPHKFEAGTPNIEGVIGLGSAIDYLDSLGHDYIRHLEEELTFYAYNRLTRLEGVTVYGPKARDRGPVIAFNMEGLHPHDMTSLLDERGICIRGGHHCAQPLMKRLNLNATCRMSMAFYNTKEEVDRLVEALEEIWRWLGKWR